VQLGGEARLEGEARLGDEARLGGDAWRGGETRVGFEAMLGGVVRSPLRQGPSQPSLSPVQLSTGSEAGLKNINSITTTANPGEQFISGNRGGRKSAGPTRTTGSTRQQDSSTLPCRQGLTLLTVPSLDCSSVWLLILMLLLFLTYLSLPYGISHSTTTPYLLASYISLLIESISPSRILLGRKGLVADSNSIIFQTKMIISWFLSKILVAALWHFVGLNFCQLSLLPLGNSWWDGHGRIVLRILLILLIGSFLSSKY
jgi:hypothetical protein